MPLFKRHARGILHTHTQSFALHIDTQSHIVVAVAASLDTHTMRLDTHTYLNVELEYIHVTWLSQLHEYDGHGRVYIVAVLTCSPSRNGHILAVVDDRIRLMCTIDTLTC